MNTNEPTLRTVAGQQCAIVERVACRLRQSGLHTDSKLADQLTAYPASPQPANPAQVTDATDEAVRLAGDILMSHGLNAPEQVIYRAAREILETAAIGAGGQAAVVKPLEWAATKEIRRHLVEGTDVVEYVSKGEFRYTLTKNYQIGSSWDATRGQYTPINQGTCVSFEAAKAAAQADYERRILSALSQPHPADERVVEALRHPLEAYAASYEQMARTGYKKVSCLDVAVDIRRNMTPVTQPLSAKEGR